MARTFVAALPAVVVLALAWSRLEDPTGQRWEVVAAGLAGLGVLVPRARRWGIVLVLIGAVAVVALAMPTGPLRAPQAVVDGIRQSSTVPSPFDPLTLSALHALVALAAFLGAAGVVFAARARQPLLAGACAIVTIGWPATLLGRDLLAWGVVAAAVALWPSVVLGAARRLQLVPAAVLVGALAVAAGAVASVGLSPEHGAVDWRRWNPLADDGPRVGVRYVWDANYEGITFPSRPTVVLRITAPRRASYWRASTLDRFDGDRWIENLYLNLVAPPDRRLPTDPLVPPGRSPDATVVEQVVEPLALDDDRMIAATQPVRIKAESDRDVLFLSGGVVRGLDRGREYRVWSVVRTPTPEELAGSPPRYPLAAQRYLELGRTRLPGFGEPRREAGVAALFRDELRQDLWPYEPLWVNARRLTRSARSPYEATLAVEAWLRSGRFAYSERPPAPADGAPPLVDFVAGARAGYCQHFAGAMAVMLRLLGIPSRVAVGFTSGRWSEGQWIVTDHQAHAWVEAWFAGYGWLPFDPTPGRGALTAEYTLASDSADAVRALGTGRFLRQPDFRRASTEPPAAVVASDGRARDLPWWPFAIVLLPLAGGAAIVLAKWARRRRRLSADDPRVVAGGVRLELADVLRDRAAGVAPNASVRELGDALERMLQVPAGDLPQTLAVARYGPPEVAGDAAARSVRELGALLRSLRRRTGWWPTFRAAVSLRSLR